MSQHPDKEIRLAMLGMSEGNGHRYSWSAIFNGYDPKAMHDCPFPAIRDYLAKQPTDTFGIAGAKVTHVWTGDRRDAGQVARFANIPVIADNPEDVIDEVDAVIVATDIGGEHVARCRPFVAAGIPVFVDKPLVDNAEDLGMFMRWVISGAPILSSSSMRYCKEFIPYRHSIHNLGELRYASVTMPNSWERYGIHALEAIYPIMGPGFVSVTNTGTANRNVVHIKHECGADVTIVATRDMYGGFGLLQLCGTRGCVQAKSADSFHAFKTQLEAFISYVRKGTRPYPFEETIELMKMVIAGIRSRDQGGIEIRLDEIATDV